jgi:hypothetical protein
MVTAAGMTPQEVAGIGFGLLTFMGRVVLGEPMAVRVHRSLQALGSRGVPVIRSIALQHLVLARVGDGGTRSARSVARTSAGAGSESVHPGSK